MDSRYRDLQLLQAIEADQHITQRTLARKLGMALGLANIYVKRMIRKGYVKCVNVQSNRLLYLVTPKGIAEKTRLGYEFMDYSLHLYRASRVQLRAALDPAIRAGSRRIAIYGVGEAAELAYLCLKEYGLEPVAIVDSTPGQMFLGFEVADVRAVSPSDYDLLIVATLEPPATLVNHLVNNGLPRERLVTLRGDGPRPAATTTRRTRSGNGER